MILNQSKEAFGPTEQGIWYERVCVLDGKPYRHELALSPELFQLGLAQMQTGAVIQDAFPTLTPQDREFILSGITPHRWNELFPPPPPLDESRIDQILLELEPIITNLFGDNITKPFELDGLTEEAIRDYPDLGEPFRSQARLWVKAWIDKKGLVGTVVNPS